MAAHLGAAGNFVHAAVRSELVDPILTERERVAPVVRRWLMQPHERVSVVPVPARCVASVDEYRRSVRIGDQGIGEGHPSRAGADHQVVRFEFRAVHHGESTRCRGIIARGAVKHARSRLCPRADARRRPLWSNSIRGLRS